MIDDPFWSLVTRAAEALEEREDMGIDAGPWTDQGAEFSDCFLYRYRLWREWDPKKPMIAFVMLNPSVANAVKLDPTVRRCIGFARSWGFGRLEIVNAFAWVATDPNGLRDAQPDYELGYFGTGILGQPHVLKKTFLPQMDPIGPFNDATIKDVCARADQVIVAWSCWVEDLNRLDSLLEILAPYRGKTYSLGYTADGTPRHPLYLPKDTERVAFVHPNWHRLEKSSSYDVCSRCNEEIQHTDERVEIQYTHGTGWVHGWCRS